MSGKAIAALVAVICCAGLGFVVLGSASSDPSGAACVNPASGGGVQLAAAVDPLDPNATPSSVPGPDTGAGADGSADGDGGGAAAPGCVPVPGSSGLNVVALLHDAPQAAPFVPWILKFAGQCPEATAPIIAAQLENESGHFNPRAYNEGSGAQGPAQFLPATWAHYGVDADGKGHADPYDLADAVATQVKYDCTLADMAHKDLASGRVHGDPTQLMLSYYNCGPGASEAAGGVCQNGQTLRYVVNIPAQALKWSAPLGGSSTLTGPVAERILGAARRWLGTTYAWGGGNQFGPTRGTYDHGGAADAHGDFNKVGFDCSGLVQYAVFQGTGGRVLLPRYTVSQLNSPLVTPVPLDQAQPGDLMFPAGPDPQHVVLYLGGSQIIQAPESGEFVDIAPMAAAVGSHPSVRRVT